MYQMLQMEHISDIKKDWIEPCNTKCSFCFLNYADVLGKNYLFRNIKPDKIGEIIKKAHHQVKTYQKGEMIAYNGDNCDTLKIIVKGSAVGEMMDFQGKSLRIEKLTAPDTIASAFIFGDKNIYPVDVIAEEETKLLLIAKEDLMKLFCEEQAILKNFLDIISNRSQLLTKKIKLLGLQTIKGKIAHYLLEQVRREGQIELLIKNTQTELANMFGVSRPSLARVIREMHNDGIINAVGKQITILDKKALSDLLR